MTTRMADKIADRLGKKLAQKTPFRSDFVLADYRAIGNGEAEVLIQYDEEGYGVPAKEAVAQTLLHLYRASDERPRITVDLSSVRYYPQHRAVACVVAVPKLRRPFSDVKKYKLTPIVAGTMFLGENMDDTWRVSKSAEGGVFIERVEDDDIETILRERSRAKAFRTQAGVSSLTLNRIQASHPETVYSIGDHVNCIVAGARKAGEIVGLTSSGAQIRFKDGAQTTVTLASIAGLVQAAEASMDAQMEAIKDYYRKAYGYSDEDLNRLVTLIK